MDPALYQEARMIRRLTYFEVLEKSLRVMDSTAVTMAMEQKIPIIVFKLLDPDNMAKVILGQEVGTLVESP
jgi:uridylate kinase